MDFALSDEQKMIHEYRQSLVRQFDQAYGIDCTEHKRFPIELYRQVAADGFIGIMVPEQYGGAGLGTLEMVLFQG